MLVNTSWLLLAVGYMASRELQTRCCSSWSPPRPPTKVRLQTLDSWTEAHSTAASFAASRARSKLRNALYLCAFAGLASPQSDLLRSYESLRRKRAEETLAAPAAGPASAALYR